VPQTHRLDSTSPVLYNGYMIPRARQNLPLEGQVTSRLAMVYGGIVCVCLVLVSCRSALDTSAPGASDVLPTPALATIHVMSTPEGASIYLDDALQGTTPNAFVVLAGQHRLRLEKVGYAARVVDLALQPGREVVVCEQMRDDVPPRIEMASVPTVVRPGRALRISASAVDNEAVVGMALLVDGHRALEVGEASLHYTVDTNILGTGWHTLVVEARDSAGNVTSEEVVFELLAPTMTPGPTATELRGPTLLATATSPPTVAPTPTTLPAARASPAPTAVATQALAPYVESPVSLIWDEIALSIYAYQQALDYDAEHTDHPYPLLDRDRVGPLEERKYRVLRMRNEYLELTLMPDLGGRIYQCRFLPTGQDLFYNNRAIKPTHWGPVDQGWWLAVGGIEFCLPVDEHGYLTAEPWNLEEIPRPDGSALATMSIVERSRNIQARVDVSLRPGESGFRIRTALHNPGAEAKSLQYWINAMLSPGSHGVGPSLRFYYPTSEVVVHSSGDPSAPGAHEAMPWPMYDGRDMSLYANWSDWLGFFAPNLRAPFTAIYDEEAELGMVRVFPPGIARGVKLFGFGPHFGDAGVYTDDGSQYVEMWGGLTPTFWDYAVLEPHTTIAWEESWYVISHSGGPSLATAEGMLCVVRDKDHLDITVASPAEHRWVLRGARGDQQIAEEGFVVRPDTPFYTGIDLPAGTDDDLVVTVEDPATGRVILSHAV